MEKSLRQSIRKTLELGESMFYNSTLHVVEIQAALRILRREDNCIDKNVWEIVSVLEYIKAYCYNNGFYLRSAEIDDVIYNVSQYALALAAA
jgi:hypothetical protein